MRLPLKQQQQKAHERVVVPDLKPHAPLLLPLCVQAPAVLPRWLCARRHCERQHAGEADSVECVGVLLSPGLTL